MQGLNAVELEKVARAPVARLATCGLDRRPHCVPVCFVLSSERLFIPLDEKPKLVEPRRLRRVRNLLENPQVAVTIDHYEDDWDKLWFIQVEGLATLALLEAAERELLEEKYVQYRSMRLQHVISVEPRHAISWQLKP
jgi:coenzyme F420-0:L-glutamate ligase/coenzyme F420-1:gamma-L-glutamate ligase